MLANVFGVKKIENDYGGFFNLWDSIRVHATATEGHLFVDRIPCTDKIFRFHDSFHCAINTDEIDAFSNGDLW
jgi:hypothetical protein